MSTHDWDKKLLAFAHESNLIENINDPRRDLVHAAALEKFLAVDVINTLHLQVFVRAIQPDAKLRVNLNDRVWIGGREAMPGDKVVPALINLLDSITHHQPTRLVHLRYEYIHPFTDGNGRSGRALWLWQMLEQQAYQGEFGFLQMFYYQTLSDYTGELDAIHST